MTYISGETQTAWPRPSAPYEPPAPPSKPSRRVQVLLALCGALAILATGAGVVGVVNYRHQHETRFGPRKSGWNAVSIDMIRQGIAAGAGFDKNSAAVDCVTDYVTSHYSARDIEAMTDAINNGSTSDDTAKQIGYTAGKACLSK